MPFQVVSPLNNSEQNPAFQEGELDMKELKKLGCDKIKIVVCPQSMFPDLLRSPEEEPADSVLLAVYGSRISSRKPNRQRPSQKTERTATS